MIPLNKAEEKKVLKKIRIYSNTLNGYRYFNSDAIIDNFFLYDSLLTKYGALPTSKLAQLLSFEQYRGFYYES